MPNWCNNYISVEGNRDRLIEFDRQFKQPQTHYSGGLQWLRDDADIEAELKRYTDKNQECRLVINGDRKQIAYIDSQETREGYSFKNFVPMTKDNWLNGWYDWQCENFGTKWDIAGGDMYPSPDMDNPPEDLDSIQYSFDTAWGPCIPVVAAMAKQYPDLTFRHEYDECGMCFAGVLEYENGELVSSDETDNDNYREFTAKYFGQHYFRCGDCNHLIDEWELDEEDICPECGCTTIYDNDTNELITPKEAN